MAACRMDLPIRRRSEGGACATDGWCKWHPSPTPYRGHPLPHAVEGFDKHCHAIPLPPAGEGAPGRGWERGATYSNLRGGPPSLRRLRHPFVPLKITHARNNVLGQRVIDPAIGVAGAHQGDLRVVKAGQAGSLGDDLHAGL
jgi:hypothetical protein